ncbi:glucose-6-phosphate dehydrogenase [Pseudokineococcus lusitanus]|uniref:Glucose-6-phosphate 1-dehydrogenase n=1 Tax=Pseudokineococcus lusitanus TaxID=763993 RepID=A0A3N1HTZ8_9ACTN|nr:glucose-6-phosphate dehydrogenase (NADP(+)) [Pseudokineococcus lusitanus]ROP46014.1 glucose-6-phosphate 1-dehydrogenase [Pseudokineococcus lusitanus]
MADDARPDPAARPAPTVFVLYGATGDLARRMVLPAFYDLACRGLMPEDWRLVGNGRGDVAHEDFRGHVREVLEEFGPHPDSGPWEDFSQRLLFAGGGFTTDSPGSLLDVLRHAREDMAELGEQAQLVHYLAIPPSAFEETTRALGEHDLADGATVVYEKPFGTSPESFRELDALVHEVLDEEQVFRIDHFLGKEGTQALHVLRFGNALFGNVWGRDSVEQVQVDVPEDLDVADRAGFYDETGALLDMLVTHLLQVTAEVAMEAPASSSAEDLQTAREAVLAAVRPLQPEDVVLGQYEGYTDIDGVPDGSTTDTFVAARVWVDTDRWHGVPFLLRTGKRMAQKAQRVSLVLRRPEAPSLPSLPVQGNVLTVDISGSGALDIGMVLKQPGPDLVLTSSSARLQLCDVAGGDPLPPYVALLHDVLHGDRSLFTSSDGLQAAWSRVEPVLRDRPAVQPYAPGSWGPAAADELAGPGGWLLGGSGSRDDDEG